MHNEFKVMEERYEAIEELMSNPQLYNGLKNSLARFQDLELILSLCVRQVSGQEWEKALLEAFEHLDPESPIEVARFVSRTLETELEANTNSVIPFFGVTVRILHR